jgi:hypothetical protein
MMQLPLGLRREAMIDPEHLEVLRSIEAYDLTPIRARILADGLMPPSWVDEAILEFRRYLGLIAVSDDPVPMTSKAVDEVWHTCLLFTRVYEDLCERTVGRFIHHEPTAELDATPDTEQFDFGAAYERLYGPPGRLWQARPAEY